MYLILLEEFSIHLVTENEILKISITTNFQLKKEKKMITFINAFTI